MTNEAYIIVVSVLFGCMLGNLLMLILEKEICNVLNEITFFVRTLLGLNK